MPSTHTGSESEHRYIALLRAVNVGGTSIIKMSDLKAQFEAFGATDVKTHIQSGNVVFTTREADPERLARRIETHLKQALGYKGTVFLFTRAQLEKAAAGNPFDPEQHDDQQAVHLMFLSAEPDEAHRTALMQLQGEEYTFAVRDNVLYFAYPRALAGSRRNINIEKVLGVTGTARTWKVVAKLIELAR